MDLDSRFNVDVPTPDAAIPEPLKKTQVTAAKRLQKELAERAKSNKVSDFEAKKAAEIKSKKPKAKKAAVKVEEGADDVMDTGDGEVMSETEFIKMVDSRNDMNCS